MAVVVENVQLGMKSLYEKVTSFCFLVLMISNVHSEQNAFIVERWANGREKIDLDSMNNIIGFILFAPGSWLGVLSLIISPKSEMALQRAIAWSFVGSVITYIVAICCIVILYQHLSWN